MGKIRTGLWLSEQTFNQIDGRTRVARLMRSAKWELIAALGGNLSPQQKILLDRLVFILFKAKSYEALSLSGVSTSDHVDKYYLNLVGELRRLLEVLGLKRMPKESELILSRLHEGDDALLKEAK